jgi:molecular chaperone GrpE
MDDINNTPEDTEPGPDAGTTESPELQELQDKYLRLAAEFDNYRKRTAKERGELWAKAQADFLEHLVDALDDLSRFAQVDEGVALVERKFRKELTAIGAQRVDQAGVPFDPNVHEAVTTRPAAKPEEDQTVGSVLQPGYRLGTTLVRPARVEVLTWRDDHGDGA